MHRAVTKKLLLSVKLKDNNCCYCIRMYKKFSPANETTEYFSTEFKYYKQLIIENLGVNKEHADRLLRNNFRVLGIERRKILKNCEICENQGVDIRSNVQDLEFLELTQDDLENRILLLKEMGARCITAAMLRTCSSRVHIVTFKAYTNIPSDEVIVDNIYSHLYTSPPNVPDLGELNDYMTVKNYRHQCLKHYLKWRLEIPNTDVRLIEKLSRQLKYKSFSRLRDSVDLLHNELKLSMEQITSGKNLLHILPVDLRNILTHSPIICGVSIKELLMKNIGLIKMNYENTVAVKCLLEEFGITSEQLSKTPLILVMNADDLENGLKLIKTTPQLSVITNHPSFLQILLTKDGIQRRMDYLRYLNVTDATVSILGKSTSDFDRYLRNGSNRLNGKDLIVLLNKYFHKDPTDIKQRIKRHPLWRHANLITVHNTLKYLLQRFDTEDIYDNLQLLLYFKENVEYALTGLTEINKQIDVGSRYTPRQLLALSAYQIEKKFHFTGDGVWDKSKQFEMPRNREELNQETEEWKDCQKKRPLNDVNIFLFINTNKIQRLP